VPQTEGHKILVLGNTIYLLFWLLMAGAILMPFFQIWLGYRKMLRSAVVAVMLFLGTLAFAWLLYSYLENTEMLRQTLGGEAHEALALALHFLTIYVAPPAVFCAVMGHILGRWRAKRRENT
jgi:hypothetical protein